MRVPPPPQNRLLHRLQVAACGTASAFVLWAAFGCAAVAQAPGNPPSTVIGPLTAAQNAFTRNALEEAIVSARLALQADPNSQQAKNILIEALTKSGQDTEALNEAERLVTADETSPVLLSQRGFLRRKANRPEQALEDFARARQSPEVTPAQIQTLDAAIADANSAMIQRDLDTAQGSLDRGEYPQAASSAGALLQKAPDSEAGTRVLVDALSRSGQVAAALNAADRFIARGSASPGFRAVRGYIRRKAEDLEGAADDFRISLQDPALSSDSRRALAAALAEATAAVEQKVLADAQRALDENRIKDAIELAKKALERNTSSVFARSVLSAALARANRVGEAISELDALIAQNPDGAANFAQRGYYQRRIGDLDGARNDFKEAIRLTSDDAEKSNLQKALDEVERASQGGAAQVANRQEDDARARIDALIRAKRFPEALHRVSALIRQPDPKGWMFVQRGMIYRELNDHAHAIPDLRRALRNYKLEPATVVNVRFWLMDSTAQDRKQAGDVEGALAIYRNFLASHPRHAEAWYRLGYMLLAEKRINEAGPALLVAIGIRPTTTAYLDAAGTFILTDAPKASELYRKGIDGAAARKPGDTIPSVEVIERIKNEVVKADNSFRMLVGVSGISARPLSAGGRSVDVGSEATVRFDGRYLPGVEGLEAYARFYRGADQTGFVETTADVGVRWRPFRDIDFYLSPAYLQRFQPDEKAQIALNWGLGLGGAAFPYAAQLSKSALDPYWDFAALGSYRTADRRYLQDFIANVGFTYGARYDHFKTSIGPTLLALASFDSAARGQWAVGAGPSVMGRLWFGGDQYRSYDALLQFQVGYVFAIGQVERQQGWRGKIILYY